MSDRWCDDCSWPYDCMAANACRRAEMGERRIAAPPETADAIAAELAQVEVVSEGGPATMRRRGPLKINIAKVVAQALHDEAQRTDERIRRMYMMRTPR